MTESTSSMDLTLQSSGIGFGRATPNRMWSWMPSWDMISTKLLELRKRRGLMIMVVLLTIAFPVLVLGIRMIFHAVDPSTYGPAGTPSTFQGLANTIAEFGFIMAAAVGATAATSDLTDGLFRHLVVTGRSRLSLYIARIPSGLSIIVAAVAVGFAVICLVTCFAGVAQPTTVGVNGATAPVHLDQSQLERYLLNHPTEADDAIGPVQGSGAAIGPTTGTPESATITHDDRLIKTHIATIYTNYVAAETSQLNPPNNEMVKIGLWLELEATIGFIVGLGLGSLTGQRTVTTIVLIALELIITPLFAHTVIPHFLDGQRLIVGIAMDQLRPAGLASGLQGGGRALFGGRGVLQIPSMPTWAMISMIAGWAIGWSVIGAWKMCTRDA